MACSTSAVPSSVVHNSPDNGSSCSDDDVPLSKLQARPRSEEKQSHGNTSISSPNSEKDKHASDDSSDDEPLIKKKTISSPANKSLKKDNESRQSNGTNDKKADKNSDDSSDNEPLIKIVKMSAKAAKKSSSLPPKKSAESKKKESQDDGDSSNDEPLSELVKKLYPRRQRKASGSPSGKMTPVVKSKRNAGRERVKYAESSSDSSDDEPLTTVKRKLTKASKEQKTSGNSKITKPKDESLKDNGTDDDDGPLANLLPKKTPMKENTKKTTASPDKASKKSQGHSDESSDDEPLINLVKKNHTDKRTKNKPKALPPKRKRNTTPKKPRKTSVPESSSTSAEDEPLIKAAKHPQVTKILSIILERCDGKKAGDIQSLIKTSTEQQIDEKTSRDESEDSKESLEGQ